MDEKKRCLENLQHIKKEHQKLLLAVELLVNGSSRESEDIKNPSPCSFEQWSDNETLIKQRVGVQLFDKLTALHKQWHTTYFKIIDIYFPKNKGLFGKLLSKKPNQLEIDKAKSYLDDLQRIADEFFKTLDVSKRRIQALSDSKFS